ncbi:dUTPase [Salibacterium salarium]|uniref:dUTPase n=1 Tax=Salibacterium salarium TaxID=284579 RepID=A0A428N1M4_9BACI|nr:dUTP diphosphatase [Salibacterium salarium]RSL32207.1 dUTPase [Salibacterium salarium]
MEQLFSIQRQLDNKILEEHGLQRDEVRTDKLLALQVEIGELANETRCFKYWSRKPAADEGVILEEYVDGLHFILSLGIDGGWEKVPAQSADKMESLTEQFHAVYQAVAVFYTKQSRDSYLTLFQTYLKLGEMLGYNEQDIETAYMSKNNINHKRQNEGY